MIRAQIKPRPRLKAVVTRPYQGKGYAEGYEIGKREEYDRFWDAYQENGELTNYYNRFIQAGWTDETFKPKYPIICKGTSTAGRSVFYNARMTKINVPIIVTGVSAKEMFNQCTRLETVSQLVLEGVTDCGSMFSGCTALKNLNIEGSIGVDFSVAAAADLTNDSAQSIIDHLAVLEVKDSKTWTFHSTVGNNLTETQKAAITAKKWKLVY